MTAAAESTLRSHVRSVMQDPRRVADHDAVRGHVIDDDAPHPDEAVAADAKVLANHASLAEVGVGFDMDGTREQHT
jgi:hypothetical protein